MKKQLFTLGGLLLALPIVGLAFLGLPIGLVSADPLSPPSLEQPTNTSEGRFIRNRGMRHSEQASHGEFLKLGLAPDKLAQCQSISREAHQQGRLLHTSLQQKQQALWDYVKQPDANQSQALLKVQEVDQLRSKLEAHRLESVFKLKAVMTPAQFSHFSAIMKDKRNQHIGYRQ
jgi:Spy/CpxP family protein refolding chaperone